MWFLPSRDQWRRWSLPSKLTAIGAYVGIISIPLAVGLFALSLYLQERSASVSFAPVSNPKHIPVENNADTSTLTNVPSAQQDSAEHSHTSADSHSSSADFLAKLLLDLKSKDLTSLQKNLIRKRLAGQRTQWAGYVRETTKVGSGSGEMLLLIWTPASQVHEFMPEALAATFSAEHEVEVTALRKNDYVVIEGTIGFTSQGLDTWVPELSESRLISVGSK